jgi:hypothetical protein
MSPSIRGFPYFKFGDLENIPAEYFPAGRIWGLFEKANSENQSCENEAHFGASQGGVAISPRCTQ